MKIYTTEEEKQARQEEYLAELREAQMPIPTDEYRYSDQMGTDPVEVAVVGLFVLFVVMACIAFVAIVT